MLRDRLSFFWWKILFFIDPNIKIWLISTQPNPKSGFYWPAYDKLAILVKIFLLKFSFCRSKWAQHLSSENMSATNCQRNSTPSTWCWRSTRQDACDRVIPMTNEFSGHIAHRLYCIAALEHKNHKINYALCVLPCSAANPTHSLHPKTHPSWVYLRIFLKILSNP